MDRRLCQRGAESANLRVDGPSSAADPLKENVIIGKLIPAGTGMTRYRSIRAITTGEGAISDDEDGSADAEVDVSDEAASEEVTSAAE